MVGGNRRLLSRRFLSRRLTHSLGQTNLRLVPALTPRLPYRAVCKEEGPGLPKEKGRAGSWPINQHKQAPSRSLWPELCLMTSAVILLSCSQNLLAGAGSVFPCTHALMTICTSQFLPCPYTVFFQAKDVFKGLMFNLYPANQKNL